MHGKFIEEHAVAHFARLISVACAVALALGCSHPDHAGQATAPALEPAASSGPSAPLSTRAKGSADIRSNPMKEAFFGEQHIHTSYSLDAYLGGTRLTPFDAYRFAKGEEVEVNGVKHKLDRPLDWVAVTDHAEYIGEMYSTFIDGAPGHDQQQLIDLRGMSNVKERKQWFMKYVVTNNRGEHPKHPAFYGGPETTKSAWKQIIVGAAEEYNQPGKFSTIIAYEWTAAPGGANLHRNIFFRDTNVPDAPMSSYEMPREEALWQWMKTLEDRGMKVMAIPHNSNASKTLMFGSKADSDGKPFDAAYVALREHFERDVEIMQIKGNSEVNRAFWAADEFSGFENADSIAKFSQRVPDQTNYVRWGVIEGMAWQKKLGTNPLKLGFVGGTDDHNGLTAEVMEAGSYGKGWMGAHGVEDGSVERLRNNDVGGWIDGKDENPGALTGVWAPRNTRADIWDALYNRETFATSGTRVKLRFFGGAKLSSHPANPIDLVSEGYAHGVPMGGTLTGVDQPPHFSVYAIKDPDGANLDRVQIIKGWVDDAGTHHEKIVNVAWSGGRKADAAGKLQALTSTVDVTSATYTNDTGSAELMGSWTDTGFDPKQHALYYARVLEIPTPRWTTYQSVRNNLPLLTGVPATIQERAWSSPIWIDP